MDGPPADPEDWTDDEWLAWLGEQDAAAGGAGPPSTAPVVPRRSLPAELLGGAMKGLAEALYGPRKQEIEIVSEAPGDPPDGDPLELHLDEDDPTRSRAILRPWRRRPDRG